MSTDINSYFIIYNSQFEKVMKQKIPLQINARCGQDLSMRPQAALVEKTKEKVLDG